MSVASFEAMIARLAALAAAVPEAARVAVHAGQEPAFEESQNVVPVDTGTLKASGVHPDAELEGTLARDVISYGNGDTMTDWNGVGYEIFVHEGTRFMAARKFLEGPVMQNMSGFLEREGAAFQAALEGVRA